MSQKSDLHVHCKIVLSFLMIAAVSVLPGASDAMDAAPLYGSKCAACHGPKGEGSPVGPALKGDPFVTQGATAEIKKVILMGRMEKDKKYPNFMTAMPGGLVSEAEAEALVSYLIGDIQK
ncbi:MAG: cytochrome c [Nitrospirae bacterium]|nr:cytochrome c [Nitrospirota bacterium]